MELTLNESRLIGCLMEKAVTTPDQCPLTLNALVNACNQKSSRDPVLTLDRGTVQRTARELEQKKLLTSDENFRTGVVKYRQRFCNTPFGARQFTDGEYAVICLLLLRGPQTPGELRTRSARLHTFADNESVAATLRTLMDPDRKGGPVIARLPRKPGRRDHEYAHLFSGNIDSVPEDESAAAPAIPRRDRIAELEARVAVLEAGLTELQQRLKA
ncbi:MAG: DUF480 domain-containing protein [Gammaproteobacteria bacterium]|nr:DUF480 domain-containing protein [Gammaproteobacteria bacterium]MDE0367663.1 DUF480 domain-containing protein [Gammaproteobacteria bacterium]